MHSNIVHYHLHLATTQMSIKSRWDKLRYTHNEILCSKENRRNKTSYCNTDKSHHQNADPQKSAWKNLYSMIPLPIQKQAKPHNERSPHRGFLWGGIVAGIPQHTRMVYFLTWEVCSLYASDLSISVVTEFKFRNKSPHRRASSAPWAEWLLPPWDPLLCTHLWQHMPTHPPEKSCIHHPLSECLLCQTPCQAPPFTHILSFDKGHHLGGKVLVALCCLHDSMSMHAKHVMYVYHLM